MLATIPQSELVQIPIPTVFDRSLAEETSAKMTYPRGPLCVDRVVRLVVVQENIDLHASLVDEVVDDRLQIGLVTENREDRRKARTNADTAHLASWVGDIQMKPINRRITVQAAIPQLKMKRRPKRLTV